MAALPAQVPSPEQFLGHDVGADRYLCNYTDLVRYFRAVEQASDRVVLQDIGASSYGQRMLMAVITSPQNHRHLEQYRRTAERLCLARDVGDAEAAALAHSGKAVVWIDAGLHASECIAGQNLIELVWQLASRDDAEVRRILDEVVLLACPVNPDGLELVADAYMATGSTQTPVLYQRYVGHDNNRDFYCCNQLESTNVNRVFYRQWFPQIVYNHHQSAPAGTVIFTPPFRDPFNYNIDPLAVRGIELVSAHINSRFALERKPGVISRTGAPYSAWWNGGLRSTCYFHNMIGILTEVFGRPEPTPLRQTLARRLPDSDYPDPVPTQIWHARQTIDYLQTANFAVLDYAARYREQLLLGIWRMGRRAIAIGSEDHWTVTPRLIEAAKLRADADSVFADPGLRDPRVYVLRSDQPDFAAAVRLVQALQKNGIEVLRATAPFAVDGAQCPAGSLVIKAAQAFRAHILDMFEPQWHPDDFKDGKPVPPYDAAGWTLALQMDVQVTRSFGDVTGPFETLRDVIDFPAREVGEAAAGWQLDPRDSNTVIAVNRLLRRGFAVQWSPRGFYHVPQQDGVAATVQELASALGARFTAAAHDTKEARQPLHQVRVGLFDVYGGHMATGWDRWILEQYGFDVHTVWGERVTAGELRRDFDVLVFHTGLPGPRDLDRARQDASPDGGDDGVTKLQEALPPFEDWSDLGARRVRLSAANALPALRQFVQQGGTLLALGGECDKVIRHFELPIEVGIDVADDGAEGGRRRARRDEFYIPGSLVAIELDRQSPLCRGSSAQLATMFIGSTPVFTVADDDARLQVVARYRKQDTLQSGWAVGEELLGGKAAVIQARLGQGRIVLYGADVTYRGQPLGSFKLLFNAILTAGGD